MNSVEIPLSLQQSKKIAEGTSLNTVELDNLIKQLSKTADDNAIDRVITNGDGQSKDSALSIIKVFCLEYNTSLDRYLILLTQWDFTINVEAKIIGDNAV